MACEITCIVSIKLTNYQQASPFGDKRQFVGMIGSVLCVDTDYILTICGKEDVIGPVKINAYASPKRSVPTWAAKPSSKKNKTKMHRVDSRHGAFYSSKTERG